jgi:hypothetical protein
MPTDETAPAARRFPGKPFAIGLAIFLIVGTALTTYFSMRSEAALVERLHEAGEAP